MNGRSGLTLVELIVVLVILAALAGTAVTATAGLVEEARYEAANRTLGAIEEGIVGRSDRVDPSGAPWITGFVSDMGRLPNVMSPDPSIALAELWQPPTDPTRLSSVQTADVDSEVKLLTGWRGPYLRLPFGATKLITGEAVTPPTPPDPINGDPGYYVLRRADGALAVVGEPIASVWSLGANGEVGGGSYDADRSVVFESTVAPLVPPRHTGSITVRVVTPEESTTTGDHIIVRVFGPQDGRLVALKQEPFDLQARGLAGPPPEITLHLQGIPIGHRVVRAYRSTDPMPAKVSDPVMNTTATSRVAPVALVRGGVHDVRLVLETTPP